MDLKKKVALTLYEKKNIQNASCLHALCKSEYDSIRSLGFENPIAIIPNGVNIPKLKREKKNLKLSNERKKLLFLSRIHPKKGLDNLLIAWEKTKPESHQWELIIAGETSDKSYMKILRETTRKLKIQSTVNFVGGQFGSNKMERFIDSDAFILPSFSEGLPMAVLEAWSYRLPTLLSPECNLPEGFLSDASIKIETNPNSIAKGIQELISMDDFNRLRMGENGFNLVQEKFTWEKIAKSTNEMYRWILGNASKPSFING